MRISPRFSLSSAPFYSSLLVVVVMGLFIGGFWAYSEYEAYQDSVANIQQNYHQQYKRRVQEELARVADFIDYKRSQQDSRIEVEIRDKVHTAYSIAAHVNSLYGKEIDVEELRQMVVELLRPIRWDNGLGYYFAGRISTGRIDLFADKPQLEGINFLISDNKNMQGVVQSIITLVQEKGAGELHYDWTKPESSSGLFPKITFVRHFEPFDWFIGAGIYIDEMEARIKSDILDRIQQINFGDGGEIIVFTTDGTIICSQDMSLLGRSIVSLEDMNGISYGKNLLALAQSAEGRGFVEHAETYGEEGIASRRLGYVQRYENWDWVVAASISMSDMDKVINEEKQTYQTIAFKHSFLFVVLFIAAVALLLLSSFYFSLRIQQGIQHFTEFFRRAVDSKAKVEKTELSFKEFEVLGEYANRMNDDRRKQEETIKRDERRLDTLLKLGLMENLSIKEIYDFTLTRITEITNSAAGYLVTFAEDEMILQSQVIYTGEDWLQVDIDKGPFIRYDGTLQKVIDQRRSVLRVGTNIPAWHTYFPIEGTIQHRLDVPVIDNDKIVAVIGLCNKNNGYNEDDKRQTNLLLEGMWLHINRIISRKEMLRLRQLLKNITDSMPSVLIGVDSEMKVMQWNRLAEQQTGVSATLAEGHSLAVSIPRLTQHIEAIREVIIRGEKTEIRRVPVDIDGDLRYEAITIYPLNHDGVRGAVLRLDDVTDIVNMEELMIQSEKMMSVGGLAAGIAHEINNPLASVTQNLQMVKRRFSQEVNQNHRVADELGLDLAIINEYMEKRGINTMLNLIGSDAGRAVKLVHNMLSFSRKSASVFTECDIAELLDNALEFGLADYDLQKNYDFKHICITKEFEDNLRKIECEETNMQQVFLNIITNAGHALNLNIENREVPALTLRVRGDGDMVRVEIEDNGIGMDKKTCSKIFEPFFTTKGVGKGTGLGLSISYYIVADQHGGSLEVSSTPGKGTVFTIRIPYKQLRSKAAVYS